MRLYFLTKTGTVVTDSEICTSALIVDGKNISITDTNAIREYAFTCCSGIESEIEDPSVELFLKSGCKIKAIQKYCETHKGITLSQAKDAVEQIQKELIES